MGACCSRMGLAVELPPQRRAMQDLLNRRVRTSTWRVRLELALRPPIQEVFFMPSGVRAELRCRVDRKTGCWNVISHKPIPSGYISISRAYANGGKPRRAHRIIYEQLHGPLPEGMFVCHHCDNPLCINPYHLFLGTPADNSRDMKEKGRNQRGEKHHCARFSRAQVLEIRRRWRKGINSHIRGNSAELAREFGVHRNTIKSIGASRKWQHLG